jgi:beta-galactosidase/beta-glucuronidase
MTTRTRISLDGAWDFQLDPDNGADITTIQEWRTAEVPLPWQAQFDDLRLINGVAWYRRHFAYTPGSHAGAAILHFGAVDYFAQVWLNGHKLGDHEGGYLPFEFDVTQELLGGENELVVRVVDPSDDRQIFPDMPFGEIPHGKQSWYGPIGGIWQSVWLEQRPATFIRSLRLFPQPAAGVVVVAATLSGALPANAALHATVYDPSGLVVAEAALDAGGHGQAQLTGAPALWSPDTPHLYRVEATLSAGGQVQDTLSDTCGFRTVEARDGRIYLNGQPIYLRGVLDQAYYPETIYTVPSVAYLEDQARKAKALGLNCLRTHIKIEDPRYYEVADRLGLLIWTEIPNWVLLTPATDRRAKATFQAMVERDGNHPSIIAWTLINENWGTDLTRNPQHRTWLIDFYHAAKQIDPTRLIVDNSACKTNAHVAGDLEDYHPYKAIPDHFDEWDEWVDEFADRNSRWIWYADCQDQRRQGLPLIVSEFGNWGLPNPDTLKENGAEPWWFQTGHEWGDGIVHPHAMRPRFDYFGLKKVFGSFEQFIADSQ